MWPIFYPTCNVSPCVSSLVFLQVYSMNLELLGRVAPVELVVSPKIVAPMVAFVRSSKVS